MTEEIADQVKCLSCEVMLDREDSCGVGQEGPFCEECSYEYHECNDCSAVAHSDHMTAAEEGMLCEHCVHRYVRCYNCDLLVHEDTTGYPEDNDAPYCEDCINSVCFTCVMCNLLYTDDDYGEDSQCCHCTEADGVRDLQSYDYTPFPFVFHKHGTDNGHRPYFMGVELEVEAPNHSIRDEVASDINQGETYFYAKSDGSLDIGFEVCSHPSTLYYHLRSGLWRRLIRTLRQEGFKSHDTDTCGLHIHLSRGRMIGDNSAKLTEAHEIKIAFFLHTQRQMFRKLGRRNAQSYGYFVNDKELKKGANTNGSRHEALNFTSNTVEMRFPKGTLNLSTLYATLEMIDSVARWTRTFSVARLGHGRNARRAWLAFCQDKANAYEYLPSYMATRQVI